MVGMWHNCSFQMLDMTVCLDNFFVVRSAVASSYSSLGYVVRRLLAINVYCMVMVSDGFEKVLAANWLDTMPAKFAY